VSSFDLSYQSNLCFLKPKSILLGAKEAGKFEIFENERVEDRFVLHAYNDRKT
jgi:hypothetical protein